MDRPDSTNATTAEALLRAARAGNREAFRRLYETCGPQVYRTAFRLVGAPEAEDVVQEVFIALFRNPDAFDGRSAFTTWLYRVTVNACYDRMRKAQRRAAYHGGSTDAEPDRAWPADGTAGQAGLRVLQRDVQHHIEQALATLSPDLRTTLVLKEIEQHSYREIARILDCSEGTVASRLARARRQVAGYLHQVGIDAAYFSNDGGAERA